jgi:hypothetical protein
MMPAQTKQFFSFLFARTNNIIWPARTAVKAAQRRVSGQSEAASLDGSRSRPYENPPGEEKNS